MLEVIINDAFKVPGKVSISRTLDVNTSPNKIIIEGILLTHFYFEEITEITTDRYIIKGIKVLREGFGSEDINISYAFIADEIIIKGGPTIYTKEQLKDKLNEGFENEEAEKTWQKMIQKIKKLLI